MAKHRESLEIAAFVKRMFRALVRRAGEGDLEALEALADLERALPEQIKLAGQAAYRADYSFTDLGDALGISRQAARQRFGVPGGSQAVGAPAASAASEDVLNA